MSEVPLKIPNASGSIVTQSRPWLTGWLWLGLVTNLLAQEPAVPPQGMVVFNEIMYNPAASNANAQYVELYNSSTDSTFDLSGWKISGLGDYTFPAGSSITNGQYLILARDRTAFASAYGANIPVFDVFTESLPVAGQTLALLMPPATTNDADIVIDKVRYESVAPWSLTKNGASLQLIDPAQDHTRAGNWSGEPHWRYFQGTNFGGDPRGITKSLFLYPADWNIDVYLDDVWLSVGTNVLIGTNLLRNADFETGTATNWALSPGPTYISVTDAVSHSGRYSIHMTPYTGSAGSLSISQTLPGFVTNVTYTLSYWYLPNYKGTSLLGQIGFLEAIFKVTNSNFSVNSPGRANSEATNLPAFPPLWLNEVQPQNLAISNRLGQFAPWVELYNSSTNPVDLTGLYLANNYTNLTQWAFPAGTVLNPGEFKVIWLDGAESNSVPEELHANFTIPASTGSVALARIANEMPQVVDYLNYSGMAPSLSYGDYPDGQPFGREIFFAATPGDTNISLQPPRLSIRMPTNPAPILVEWPENGFDWQLETTASLTFPDWIALPNNTTTNEFHRVTISLEPGSQTQFLRLRKR